MIDLTMIITNRAYRDPMKGRLSVGDFEVLQEYPFEEVQAALTAYFRSPVGQDDLKNSPHAGRPVDAVVADILKELFPSG